MAKITSLPTELVEQIANGLSLKELSALRLAHPVVFPARTSDRLRALRPWNETMTARRQWRRQGTSVAEVEASDWSFILYELSRHEQFHKWIKSVLVCYRPESGCSDGISGAPKSLGDIGIGNAIARFSNLQRLDIGGGSGPRGCLRLTGIIKDLQCADVAPPLQRLELEDLRLGHHILGPLLEKVSRSLKRVTMCDVCLHEEVWEKEVCPALGSCALERLKISRQKIWYVKDCYEADVQFVEKGDILDDLLEPRLVEDDLFGFAPYLDYFFEGKDECSRAVGRLMATKAVYWQAEWPDED